jgi:hypothetical protein
MPDTDNNNILRFPLKPARVGRVHCPPLNIHFPQLYRLVQKVSRAQLVALGMPCEEPIAEFIDYTITSDGDYTGTVRHQPVQSITDANMESIVIRHHGSMEEASAYLVAVLDILGTDRGDVICKTDEGVFTLARRATESSWPGPMVVYAATHASDNPAGFAEWQLAIAPDGMIHEGEFL